jgi:hypothetical protein
LKQRFKLQQVKLGQTAMKRWILRTFFLGILGYVSYSAYDFQRRGYLSLPDIPDGAYTLSFKNGLRAIVLDADVTETHLADSSKYFRLLILANRDRSYIGFPTEVQPWFEDAWSWCKPPTEQEKASLELMPDDFKRQVENTRFEAVCRIDVDGQDIVRGLIFSVPRL